MSTYLSPSNESLPSLRQNAASHTNWRDGVSGFFGAGAKDIDWTTREFDENGRVKVTAMDAVMGRSQPELQAAYEQHRQRTIKDTVGRDYRTAFGSNLEVDHRTNINEVQAQVADETKRDSSTKPYLTALSQMEGGAAAIAELGERPTLPQVQQALSGLKTTNIEADRTRTNTETQRVEGRQDRLLMMQMMNQQEDRRADRELRRDQQRYENRRLDLQEARLDRKDRQAVIQQLMAGLSTLGASIAI